MKLSPITRWVTGTNYIHAYVYCAGEVVRNCTHKHRKNVAAKACAMDMLREERELRLRRESEDLKPTIDWTKIDWSRTQVGKLGVPAAIELGYLVEPWLRKYCVGRDHNEPFDLATIAREVVMEAADRTGLLKQAHGLFGKPVKHEPTFRKERAGTSNATGGRNYLHHWKCSCGAVSHGNTDRAGAREDFRDHRDMHQEVRRTADKGTWWSP